MTTPEPAYRTLEVGETIPPEAQFRHSRWQDVWIPAQNVGTKVEPLMAGRYRAPAIVARLHVSAPDFCWLCGGLGERPAAARGYERCLACNGSGYGESIQTYWKRNGITPTP